VVLISCAILFKAQSKTTARPITANLPLPLKKGGWEEWHLLKLSWVTMLADFRSCEIATYAE
jgi:hypothetical protein